MVIFLNFKFADKINKVLYKNVLPSQMALVVKNPPTKSRDIRDAGVIPGLGRFPWRRAQKSTPNILAWRIPWTEETGMDGYSPQGRKESERTEAT